MICPIQIGGAIELYFYGELQGEDRASVQMHLKQCAECRQTLEDLTLIRAALAAGPDVATPPGGDWSGFMARLSDGIERDGAAGRSTPAHGARVLPMRRRRQAMIALATAALLAIVTITALLVVRNRVGAEPDEPRQVEAGNQPSGQPAVLPASTPAAPEADPALVSLSGAHFERSKLVVLGLATRDTSSPDSLDWSHERDLATSLLRDTRLYRVAAEERGMTRLAGVMRDLELVLLQTSMSVEPDTASLEQLQRLIRRRDLITKMNTVAGP